MIVEEYNHRREQDATERLTMAYLTAYWQRVKRMPRLEDVLPRKRTEAVPQTPEQMLAVVKRQQARFERERS